MNRLSLLLGILMLAGVAQAQFKNIKIDSATAHFGLTNSSVAIVQKEGPALAAAGLSSLYLSVDGGKTWEKSKAPALGSDRILVSDGKGTLFAIQVVKAHEGSRSQISCMISNDQGHTFDEGVMIADVQGKDQAVPSASMDTKGNLLVTWTQFDKMDDSDSTCKSLIFLASSSNGKKWSKPVELSQTRGNCRTDRNMALGGTTAVGPDGKMFASWCNNSKIYLDRSFGSGIWLQNDIFVANVGPGGDVAIPDQVQSATIPDLFIDQSKGAYKGCIYLSWADQKNGKTDTDVWFMRSNNHGDNWSTPLRLGDIAAAKHQYAPKMAVDATTGFIYILFYDRGQHNDGKTDVVLAYSTDSGGNFKNVTISETPFTAEEERMTGTHLTVTASHGAIIPVWSRMDNGKTSLWTATIRQEDIVKELSAGKGKKKK
ncbi:MAG: glycosyl hydrolase [Chryseolinea sp.]